MPFLLICGIPGSGKTTRANQIKQFLQAQYKVNVVLVNEESLEMKKEIAYKDSQQEKITRAQLKSAVEKNISQSTVVILDSLNYIKGFRYELYCQARSCKTQHCILYCNTPVANAKIFNSKNLNRFSDTQFDEYSKVFEVPNQKNKWDSPLFEIRDSEDTPLQDIANTLLFEEKKSKDPISTATEIKYDSNFLFEMDKQVQMVINEIIEKQAEADLLGGVICFSSCKTKLKLAKTLSMIELKQIKQEYLNIIKSNPPKQAIDIQKQFVEYLQTIMDRL